MAGPVLQIHSISTGYLPSLRRLIPNSTEVQYLSEEYEFFPDEVKNSLPKLYSQEKEKERMVHVKFFCPWNQWTWFITEGEDQEGDFLLFGYVVGFEREWGYSSLNE